MSGINSGRRSYHQLYSKVLDKRLQFVNKVSVLVSILVSIFLRIPHGKFWWNLFLTFVIRGPLLFASLYVIKLLRYKTITVNFSHQKTLGSQIYHSVVSKKFLFTVYAYTVSSVIISGLFLTQLPLLTNYYVISKEYDVKPKINDEWVYFWYVSLVTAVVYGLQQLVFERNRLVFTYGVSKIEPKTALFAKIGELVVNAFIISTAITVGSPIFYFFVRSFIYKFNFLTILILGLDTRVPSFGLSFKNWFQFGYLSFITAFSWELVNHLFDVYATIGCLDGKKPISSYNADPINTLLGGLRNSDPSAELSRLTAFQELAYIATLDSPEGVKLRTAILNAHSKHGFIWSAILDECLLLIRETTQRINYRSSSDKAIIQKTQVQIRDEISKTREDELFGNSFITSPDKSNTNVKSYDELVNSQLNKKKYASSNQDKYLDLFNKHIVAPINAFLVTLVSDKKLAGFAQQVKPLVHKGLSIINTYRNHFLGTSFGVFFRITLKRDTESRVLNPVNYGNAVIALTKLLIHAIEEDKNLSITNGHISDVLNLIERPIRAFNNYVDILPPSVYLTVEQRKLDIVHSKHLFNLLHDLTLFNFKQLCIAYNYKLGDLFLSGPAFKLAKRVIDEEIANRK